jgi:hypothetical protein
MPTYQCFMGSTFLLLPVLLTPCPYAFVAAFYQWPPDIFFPVWLLLAIEFLTHFDRLLVLVFD